MRTLVHLSDLHFGRVDESLVLPLLTLVRQLSPDLVAISGDLTQRARAAEFKQARRFLDLLPTPRIVVPGNHDVPLYNVFSRFLRPLSRYRRFITHDLEPAYIDDEIAVLGINTARALTIKNGQINHAQVDYLRERFCELPKHIVKVVVTHHPFDMPDAVEDSALVGRAAMALDMFAACGVDLLLSGHNHKSSAGSADHRALAGYRALVVQAGTTTSTRARGEANSFNVIKIDKGRITVEQFAWQKAEGEFRNVASSGFDRDARGWTAG
jgi:3',5'-cyclic AMP phosphodiesterase CpdA